MPRERKRKMNKIMTLLLLLPACLFAAGIEMLAPPEGSLQPILNAEQKAFLAKPRAERIAFMAEEANRKPMTRWGWTPVKTLLRWKALEPTGAKAKYEVRVVCVDTGKTAFEVTTNACEIAIDNLEIARTYRWTVRCPLAGGDKTGEATFRTEDIPPRLVRLDGVPNMRDIGGRIGFDGRRIRQGLVYRSGGLNNNANRFYSKDQVLEMYRDGTLMSAVPELSRADASRIKRHLDAGKPEKADLTHLVRKWQPGADRLNDRTRAFAREQFGIRTDIDLREPRAVYGMTGSPLGPDVRWVNISSSAYAAFGREAGREAFKKVFRVFLDEANYPIDFHCIAGADRTGAVAAVIEGLLGVDEEEIYRDWEVTAFHNPNIMFRHETYFNHLIEVFDAYPGKTLNERILAYVLSLGFTQEDVDWLREFLLEKPKDVAK